ncbi:MAG: ZIP family metal transporter [Solirubrobacteraceae bacterium]
MAEVIFLASLTALATGLGIFPVYWLGARAEGVRPVLWGVVSGVMGVASVQGLLLPGFAESSDLTVVAGVLAGVAFLLMTRRFLGHHEPSLGSLTGAGARRGPLVFLVLLVHSLPEGLALGAAFASDTVGLSAFVFLAIAIQNIPEGTATAIPLREASVSRPRAFWLATLTSAPQPVGAALAYALVDATRSLLGLSFGFAAGAMLALIAIEAIPAAARSGGLRRALAAAAASAVATAALGALLHVG